MSKPSSLHVLSSDAALRQCVAAANQRVLEHLERAEPVLKRVRPAAEAVPGMTPATILHSGPPVAWEAMCPMLREAVKAGAVMEGLAEDFESAHALIEGGKVQLASCHEMGGVAPVAGVVTASMPVFVVEEAHAGKKAFCPLNEGLGKVLRYGAYGDEVTARLAWMRDVLAPVLDDALQAAGGIAAFEIMAEALHMGDECHNRQKASTNLFLKKLFPHFLQDKSGRVAEVVAFISRTDVFFLNAAMGAAKAALAGVERVPFSTIVTAIAQNGTRLGIRIAGMGRQWFEAPAPMIEGRYFEGFAAEDANPGIGDSLITEVVGLGGLAMAAAPALARYTGGTPDAMKATTLKMYRICAAESRRFTLPQLGFRGVPLGIDAARVVETGTTPVCNLGIAHRRPGVGQVGAGIIRTPPAPYRAALDALLQGSALAA